LDWFKRRKKEKEKRERDPHDKQALIFIYLKKQNKIFFLK